MRKVPDLTKLKLSFWPSIKYLPSLEEIPEKFKGFNNGIFQNELIEKWFFKGLKKDDIDLLIPKAGVDKNNALIAIHVILISWEPSHEEKMAGAAFLLSEWFEEPKIKDAKQ